MWFLEAEMAKFIAEAERAKLTPTATQREEFNALCRVTSEESLARVLSIAGDTAEISIVGLLTNAPDIWALIFGGANTIYPDIINALAAAEQNDEVSNIILHIDSPGGSISGLFPTLGALASVNKKTTAKISNIAASAAYAIAAQTDSIIAMNEATRVGSIGIIASIEVSEHIVNITSTKAPLKHPDVTTPEGRAQVQAELDPIHDAFVSAIAQGRNVHPDIVNKDFGRGGMIIATEAKKLGMIDEISSPVVGTSEGPTIAGSGGTNALAGDKIEKEDRKQNNSKGDIGMNLQELRADHLDIFQAAVEVGVVQERDRVTAHLTLAVGSGDMKTAMEAIEKGEDVSQLHIAKHNAAHMSKAETSARIGDEANTGNPEGAGAGSAEGGDEGLTPLAQGVCDILGKKYDLEFTAKGDAANG